MTQFLLERDLLLTVQRNKITSVVRLLAGRLKARILTRLLLTSFYLKKWFLQYSQVHPYIPCKSVDIK